MPCTASWSTSHPLFVEVFASVHLPHLLFGAIGQHVPHDAGCILELNMHPHWLALHLLVGDGPGAENHAQLQLCMWLVALPAWGDHAVPRLIMTGWLTRLHGFCDGFCGWFFSQWPSHILLFSWRGIYREYLQVWKSFLVIQVSPSLVCSNFLE